MKLTGLNISAENAVRGRGGYAEHIPHVGIGDGAVLLKKARNFAPALLISAYITGFVALHSLAGMQAAACLYDAARDRILCVYAGGMEPDALAKDLRKLLPKYMLPNLYEKLEALPYNANGKIDRVALKERYLHAEG